MVPKKLPRSVRKYIRKEKARIRREVLDIKEQETLIQKLYTKFKHDANTRINTNDANKK